VALLAGAAPAARPTVVEEWTFLKSHDPDPAKLIAFIEANWFVMDRIAVAQGLFNSYALYRAESDLGDEGDWNLAVVVGYPDAAGSAAILDRFNAIRAAHKTVLIDGKGLAGLGRIAGNLKVRRIADG
jgi:hypothetical protein